MKICHMLRAHGLASISLLFQFIFLNHYDSLIDITYIFSLPFLSINKRALIRGWTLNPTIASSSKSYFHYLCFLLTFRAPQKKWFAWGIVRKGSYNDVNIHEYFFLFFYIYSRQNLQTWTYLLITTVINTKISR